MSEPANPYPVPELRLEDRDGYPFKKIISPAALAEALYTRARVKVGWLLRERKATDSATNAHDYDTAPTG